MKRTKKIVKPLLTLILAYTLLLMAAFLLQEKLIFYPEELPEDYQYHLQKEDEEVFLTTSDNETINGIFYPAEGKKVILYFHGNAGSLAGWQQVSVDFTSTGFNFFIIDYRGYGKSSGKITEKGLYKDGEAALNYLLQEKGFDKGDNIIIYGRSIGSGVATELAKNHTVGGLVLESAFTSLKKVANEKMPFLLPSLLLEFKFDNLSKINKVNCPVFFLHGGADDLIAPSHTEKLFEAFEGKKEKVVIPQAGHNNVDQFEVYHTTLKETLPEFFHN